MPSPKSTRLLALLRGINVGGNRKVPMADLRQVATDLGFTDVATYIQSGNLIFASKEPAARVGAQLFAAIEKRFGFPVELVIRDARAWAKLADSCPFAKAVTERPHLVHLGLSTGKPKADAVVALRQKATAGEKVELVGDGLWIDFPSGAGTSKLSPAVIDRAVGSTVTLRNMRTVLALRELLA